MIELFFVYGYELCCLLRLVLMMILIIVVILCKNVVYIDLVRCDVLFEFGNRVIFLDENLFRLCFCCFVGWFFCCY